MRGLAVLAVAGLLAGCEPPPPCAAARACTARASPSDKDLIGTWVLKGPGPPGARLTILPPAEPRATPGLLRVEYTAGMAACGLPIHADPVAHPLVRSTLSAKQPPGERDWKSKVAAWNLIDWGLDGEGENADIHGLELAWFGYAANTAEPELWSRRCVLRRAK